MEKIKAIILAAGRGTRLKKYANGLPKGMLEFEGKTLLERQIEILRRCDIYDISIVTGYAAEKIKFEGVRLFHNSRFAHTNMVESLMAARKVLEENVVVFYADILVEAGVLQTLIRSPGDIIVTVDTDWKSYWTARYGNISTDTESLVLDGQGSIVSLGVPDIPPEQMQARYVGLLRFSPQGMRVFKEIYDRVKASFHGKPWRHATAFDLAFMTDMIQELIDQGYRVSACPVHGGWLEFDTDADLEVYHEWTKTGALRNFIRL